MTSPPFTYYGGKTGLANKIVALFPSHGHYVEPFAGSLAVLLAKPRSEQETVNDLDGDLMTFWRVLREQPEELVRACEMTPHSRAEYAACQDRADCSDLERARRVWTTLVQSRMGSLGPSGWKYDIRSGKGSRAGQIAAWARRIPEAADRLARVTLECRPALELIDRYGADRDVLLYVDPPYLGQTRGENGRDRYRCDMTAERDHVELVAALRACRAAVALSGYDSPLYADALAGWQVSKLPTLAGSGADRTEVVWSNRPLGEQASLFDGVAS